MAQQTKIASRYAKAIYDYLGENNKRTRMAEDINAIADLVSTNDELSLVFCSDVFSPEKRLSLIGGLVEKLGLNEDALKILKVLSESKRLDQLKNIAFELHKLLLASRAIVAISVESAHELDEKEKELVKKRFKGVLGKSVEPTYLIEPGLIGGIQVTAEGRTYNGTLSGWFESFEEKLVGG